MQSTCQTDTSKDLMQLKEDEEDVREKLEDMEFLFEGTKVVIGEKHWTCIAPRSSEKIGPLTLPTVIDMIKKDEITEKYYFHKQGMSEWLPGSSVPELIPYFREKANEAVERETLETLEDR